MFSWKIELLLSWPAVLFNNGSLDRFCAIDWIDLSKKGSIPDYFEEVKVDLEPRPSHHQILPEMSASLPANIPIIRAGGRLCQDYLPGFPAFPHAKHHHYLVQHSKALTTLHCAPLPPIWTIICRHIGLFQLDCQNPRVPTSISIQGCVDLGLFDSERIRSPCT